MTDIKVLEERIKTARAHARRVFAKRGVIAGVLSGAVGATGYDVEFPDVDTMHVYATMFGHQVGEPATYRLSFGKRLRWVGVSHPWGKPADIYVEEAIP